MIVDWAKFDFSVVALALIAREQYLLGLVTWVPCMAAVLAVARKLTITRPDGAVRFSVTRLWERTCAANTIEVAEPSLLHWQGAFCGGIELLGRDTKLVARSLMVGMPKVPETMGARRIGPPMWQWSLRHALMGILNIAILILSIVLVRDAPGWLGLLTIAAACGSIVSTIVVTFRGAPSLKWQANRVSAAGLGGARVIGE